MQEGTLTSLTIRTVCGPYRRLVIEVTRPRVLSNSTK